MGTALIRGLQAQVVRDLTLSGAVDLSSVPGQGSDVAVLAGIPPTGVKLTPDLPAQVERGDVFIDFSFHGGIVERGQVIAGGQTAWVIGTTGLTGEEKAGIAEVSSKIPVILSANMSLGVNLLAVLVESAAASLKGRGYDIEIIEKHHRYKLDAPSGTALFLGEAAADGAGVDLAQSAVHGRAGVVAEPRGAQEIGFHAVRGGDIVGDHQVLFCADGEMIELAHRATSRDTFAIGALQAASWIVGKPPGLYSMRDVLGLD